MTITPSDGLKASADDDILKVHTMTWLLMDGLENLITDGGGSTATRSRSIIGYGRVLWCSSHQPVCNIRLILFFDLNVRTFECLEVGMSGLAIYQQDVLIFHI